MLVNYTKTNGDKHQYHLADWTSKQLNNIKNMINKKDADYVMIIDGQEGSGKSTLATQVARYVDPTFTQDRMCLTPEQLITKVNECSKGQAVVFDEAFTGLSSRRAMTEVNNVLVEMMMEMRKKNLFVIMCIPSVFYLEKYVALHRAKSLLHTYQSRGRRGQYTVYNQKNLKWLYLSGKQKMSYAVPRVNIKQRFPSATPIDWVAYEGRKIQALKRKDKQTLKQRQQYQRDVLLAWLNKEGYSEESISKILILNKADMSRDGISYILKGLRKKNGENTIELGDDLQKKRGCGREIPPSL